MQIHWRYCFYFSENVFISSLYSGTESSKFTVFPPPFSIFKLSLHYLQDCVFSDEKKFAVTFIFSPLYIMSLFFGWLTWCFSYEISAIRVLHAYMFFFLLLLGMLYASWICGVLSCINFGKVSALLFKHLFSLVLSPSLPLFASSLCPPPLSPSPFSSFFLSSFLGLQLCIL